MEPKAPLRRVCENWFQLSIVRTMAIIAIAGWVSEASSQTPFVTSVTLGALKNDFNGWLGMEITVGGTPVIVTSLGNVLLAATRLCTP